MGFCPKKVSAYFACVLKHVREVTALDMISNIARISVCIVADYTGMLAAQLIFADITLKLLRRRQSTCTETTLIEAKLIFWETHSRLYSFFNHCLSFLWLLAIWL